MSAGLALVRPSSRSVATAVGRILTREATHPPPPSVSCPLRRRFANCPRSPMQPPPTPPPEKKWFYREVWSALQPKLQQLTTKKYPSETGALKDLPTPPGSATCSSSQPSWIQRITDAREQATQLAEKYGLREKLNVAFEQYCRFLAAVKNFFYQKQYMQLGTLVDDGLKKLEDKIRMTREGRIAAREDAAKGTQQCSSSGSAKDEIKIESSEKPKCEEKIFVKLHPKALEEKR